MDDDMNKDLENVFFPSDDDQPSSGTITDTFNMIDELVGFLQGISCNYPAHFTDVELETIDELAFILDDSTVRFALEYNIIGDSTEG